jgi:hypothetical protein
MKGLISFDVARWNADAERLLQGATGPDPTYTIAEMRAEVQSGQSTLMLGSFQDEKGKITPLGYVVVWRDDFGGSPEFVVQAGAAFSGTIAAMPLVVPALEELARQNGCDYVRTHVSDPKFLQGWKRAGYHRREIVMAKKVV